MSQYVHLDSAQEAALTAAAVGVVRMHHGDTMKALKEQMLLNTHLQERVEMLSGELKYPYREDDQKRRFL